MQDGSLSIHKGSHLDHRSLRGPHATCPPESPPAHWRTLSWRPTLSPPDLCCTDADDREPLQVWTGANPNALLRLELQFSQFLGDLVDDSRREGDARLWCANQNSLYRCQSSFLWCRMKESMPPRGGHERFATNAVNRMTCGRLDTEARIVATYHLGHLSTHGPDGPAHCQI